MTIGITGGIGSGKSTIVKELSRRGYTIYDCDKEAKHIIETNDSVRKAIIALLGERTFEGGNYNTKYVAERVFAEPKLLEQLNAVVHPAVKKDIMQSKPNFVESALLYESGLDAICDVIFHIDAPEQIRIERTMSRDRCDEKSVRARINAQQTKPHKGALVILNDGSRTIEEIADLIQQKIYDY